MFKIGFYDFYDFSNLDVTNLEMAVSEQIYCTSWVLTYFFHMASFYWMFLEGHYFGHYLPTIWSLFGHYLVTFWPLCGCYLVTISLTSTGSFLKVIYVYCLKGYINCGTCSHPELTLDHVLTSAFFEPSRGMP